MHGFCPVREINMYATSVACPSTAPEPGVRVAGLRSMRLPWRFDVDQALAEALSLPTQLWRTHFNQGRHDGGWQALALRAVPQTALDILPVQASVEAYVDCDALRSCPSIKAILQSLGLPLQSVRLMQLLPGSEIMEHTDSGVSAAYGEARLHIPLQTDDQVFFHIAGQRIPMHAGECWYTDVSLPHRVRNRSGQTRLHLVVDVVVTERLALAFTQGDAGNASTDDNDPWIAFERFREAVFQDPALADELVACLDLPSLAARSVQLGQVQGYLFEVSDVESAMKAGRNAWRQQWIL